jgi:hypothetical protein
MKLPTWFWIVAPLALYWALMGVAALALLMRRKWTQPLFVVSLLGAVLQFGWVFFAVRTHETIGPSAAPFLLTIIVIGIALVFFSRSAARLAGKGPLLGMRLAGCGARWQSGVTNTTGVISYIGLFSSQSNMMDPWNSRTSVRGLQWSVARGI